MAPALPYPPEVLKKMDERIGIIRMISGKTAKGEDFYAYVSVKPSMYEEFDRKITAQERMNVDSFGKVLHKGFGQEPSEDVKHFMEEQYGIDPNFPTNFAEAMKQQALKYQEAQQQKEQEKAKELQTQETGG